MDIKWLKTFIVAAKYENFRQASEELFLTQPAITKHIRRLEEHLSIQLFDRQGKAVVLTPAGYKFLPYAKEMISTYEKGFNDFESWKQGYNRKLIIASAPQIASSILPSLLRDFVENNPDIEVIVNIINSYDIGDAISAGRADIGLSRIQPVQVNVKTEIVHEDRVILVGPAEDEKGSIMDEKTALKRYRLITHNHPVYWDELLNNIKMHYPTVRTMNVNQIEITKRFIEAGLGVSFLPLTMVKDEISMNKLLEIPSGKISVQKSSTFVVTKAETVEVGAFMQFLKAEIMNM